MHMNKVIEDIQDFAGRMNNLGTPLSYDPKDRDEFEVHRAKAEAVETLKEELQEMLAAVDYAVMAYQNALDTFLETRRQMEETRNELDDIKFRLNCMLTHQFTSDE